MSERAWVQADADTLRGLREGVGLSQQQLADRLGATRAQVAGWETGRRSPQGNMRKVVDSWMNAAAGLEVVTNEAGKQTVIQHEDFREQERRWNSWWVSE